MHFQEFTPVFLLLLGQNPERQCGRHGLAGLIVRTVADCYFCPFGLVAISVIWAIRAPEGLRVICFHVLA